MQRIIVPLKPISWNVLARQNHWKYTKIKNEWAYATMAAIKQARTKPVQEYPISIVILARWKQKRRHDIDSLYIKACLDMLVEQRILKDDDLIHVESVTTKGEIGVDKDELIIEIICSNS